MRRKKEEKLFYLEIHLRMSLRKENRSRLLTAIVFCTQLGVLAEAELKLLRKCSEDHFESRSATEIPHVKDINEWQRQVATETHVFLRSYAALEGILGFKKWPECFALENVETLSDDQALTLRGCFSDQESDPTEDWPKSIVLVLKQGFFLHNDLGKFVGPVIA
jgi:hypothetical protein